MDTVARTPAPAEPEAEAEHNIQYYGRSELPKQGVTLHRFSLRRKSTLIGISLLATFCLLIAGMTTVSLTTARANEAIAADPARGTYHAQKAMGQARTKFITFGAGSIVSMLATALIMMKTGPRIVALEFWIRRMGAGDLNYSVRPTGNDEITEIAYDLEVMRRRAVRAQRLDLVQELSDSLQDKNDELENVLVELRTTQDQVISRQKLAELGELTAGVAHEIRNPLNMVQNFSKTSTAMMTELKDIVEELEGPPDDEQNELIAELVTELSENMQRIQHHGDRANRIVQDMLDIGRSSKGKYQDVDINLLLEDHAMLAYHAARSHDSGFNMRIVREMDQHTGTANVVSEDIGRVILNLVGNACYATAERGQQEPEHEPTMWLSTQRSQNSVVIKIRDNGNGIPADIISKIFNPFFTTKPTDRGTGLGLSLSNDIVREHGGTITAESQPTEYTEFTVLIPTNQNGETTKPDENDDAVEP